MTRFFLVFLIIAGISSALIHFFAIDFGKVDYWKNHGFFFLVFIALFPRATLLFSSAVFGGFLGWLGWLFAPRVLVAVLATLAYWQTNKILVTMSWLVALSGESSEKYYVYRKRQEVDRVVKDVKSEVIR